VAVVLAIQITNQTTLDSLRKVFDRTTGQASLLVVPVNEKKRPLDESVLAKVVRIEGIDVAAPSLRSRTLLASDASSWQIAFSMSGIAAGSFFQLYGVETGIDAQVRVYILDSGDCQNQINMKLRSLSSSQTKRNCILGTSWFSW